MIRRHGWNSTNNQYYIDYKNHDDEISKEVFPYRFFNNPKIWHASRIGDEAKVKMCIKETTNFNLEIFYETTPLMVASINNHFGVVRLLIEAGYSIHTIDLNGENCLFYSVKSNLDTKDIFCFVLNKFFEKESEKIFLDNILIKNRDGLSLFCLLLIRRKFELLSFMLNFLKHKIAKNFYNDLIVNSILKFASLELIAIDTPMFDKVVSNFEFDAKFKSDLNKLLGTRLCLLSLGLNRCSNYLNENTQNKCLIIGITYFKKFYTNSNVDFDELLYNSSELLKFIAENIRQLCEIYEQCKQILSNIVCRQSSVFDLTQNHNVNFSIQLIEFKLKFLISDSQTLHNEDSNSITDFSKNILYMIFKLNSHYRLCLIETNFLLKSYLRILRICLYKLIQILGHTTENIDQKTKLNVILSKFEFDCINMNPHLFLSERDFSFWLNLRYEFRRIQHFIIYLIIYIFEKRKFFKNFDTTNFYLYVQIYFDLTRNYKLYSIWELVCSKNIHILSITLDTEIIKFVLQNNYDPDIEYKRNTFLNYYLFNCLLFKNDKLYYDEIIKIFLEFDAHLDYSGYDNQTLADMYNLRFNVKIEMLAENNVSFKKTKDFKLQCLVSKVIKKHHIRYKELIPIHLIDFVNRH